MRSSRSMRIIKTYRVQLFDVESIYPMPKTKFDTDSPHTSKTHQSSESKKKKMSETFYLSWWATLPVIDGPAAVSNCPTAAAAASTTTTTALSSFTHASICTPFEKQPMIAFLKNDSQYPLAIEVNNFPLLKAGGKIETDSGREEGRETCQHCFLY